MLFPSTITNAVALPPLHAVFEWDASSHGYAYSLWLKAVCSDGGEGCRKKTELSGEPLIPGMLVGTEADLLTTSQTHQVGHFSPGVPLVSVV